MSAAVPSRAFCAASRTPGPLAASARIALIAARSFAACSSSPDFSSAALPVPVRSAPALSVSAFGVSAFGASGAWSGAVGPDGVAGDTVSAAKAGEESRTAGAIAAAAATDAIRVSFTGHPFFTTSMIF